MKQFFQLAIMSAALGALLASAAQAQTMQSKQSAQADTTTAQAGLAAPVHPDPYVPPNMRHAPTDAPASGPLLQYQTMQKLKQRFEAADTDGSGTLSREEAHKAGLGFIDKNFDHIDSAQRGTVSFEDLKAYLIQRREEARSR